ncbi:uncharacterized protein LOC108040883 [Drosophila rhopaloa]|uniref:Uncharacterized protein LOC108040883 n=1 Tax=Drosophila rhopaloa TaxID=1041015 RepID=A0A6P4E7L0_DRORH|nr:uncharacterized protein LOC108040883 [Drosophila rhopaloa]
MIVDYIVTSIRYVEAVFLADFLRRFYLSAVEYIRFRHNYLPEDRLRMILCRSFTYKMKSICVLLPVTFLGIGISIAGNFSAVLPTSELLLIIPLNWLLNDLGHSPLTELNWLRDSHGLDFATGMASSLFHGCLKLSLPEWQNDGLKPRMALYEARNNITFGLDRLVILSPSKSSDHNILKSDLLKEAKPLQTRIVNRAGVDRHFRLNVYKINRKVNGKIYYFVIELATPLITFSDALQSELTATRQMKQFKREIRMRFNEKLKDLIRKDPEIRNKVYLITYIPRDEEGNPVDITDLLISYMKKNKTVNMFED